MTNIKPSPSPVKVRILKATVALLLVLILFSSIQRILAARQEGNDAEICYAHLKEISAAIKAYQRDHNGRLPVELKETRWSQEAALYPKYIKSLDVLICPKAAEFRSQRGQWQPGQVTYDYPVMFWLRDSRDDKYFRSVEFYREIVPKRGNRIRLAQCTWHPGNGKIWAVMLDGSIREQPYLYDPYFGRGSRDPGLKASGEAIRKRGGRFIEEPD
jgi:hypothetical protein